MFLHHFEHKLSEVTNNKLRPTPALQTPNEPAKWSSLANVITHQQLVTEASNGG